MHIFDENPDDFISKHLDISIGDTSKYDQIFGY
jgi:hypothetical protein